MTRKLTPELLDHLPHNDPGAMRSRRDLRHINCLMGNDRWIGSVIPKCANHITEIGAGDGHLLAKIAKQRPTARFVAYDLAPRPADLPAPIEWRQGNLFSQEAPGHGGTLIANLFLHHFNDSQLHELGQWIHGFETIIINEPLRSRLSALLGKIATPFVHPITRHDMRVSIEAGFAPGELSKNLGLSRSEFEISERTDWRGAIRVLASRN